MAIANGENVTVDTVSGTYKGTVVSSNHRKITVKVTEKVIEGPNGETLTMNTSDEVTTFQRNVTQNSE